MTQNAEATYTSRNDRSWEMAAGQNELAAESNQKKSKKKENLARMQAQNDALRSMLNRK